MASPYGPLLAAVIRANYPRVPTVPSQKRTSASSVYPDMTAASQPQTGVQLPPGMPQVPGAGPQQPQAPPMQGIWGRIKSAAGDPRTAAVLASMAGQLARPRQQGQSEMQAFTQALVGGYSTLGQANAMRAAQEAARREEMRKTLELQSQIELRGAQAGEAKGRGKQATAEAEAIPQTTAIAGRKMALDEAKATIESLDKIVDQTQKQEAINNLKARYDNEFQTAQGRLKVEQGTLAELIRNNKEKASIDRQRAKVDSTQNEAHNTLFLAQAAEIKQRVEQGQPFTDAFLGALAAGRVAIARSSTPDTIEASMKNFDESMFRLRDTLLPPKPKPLAPGGVGINWPTGATTPGRVPIAGPLPVTPFSNTEAPTVIPRGTRPAASAAAQPAAPKRVAPVPAAATPTPSAPPAALPAKASSEGSPFDVNNPKEGQVGRSKEGRRFRVTDVGKRKPDGSFEVGAIWLE